jgi:hypothetical protein
MSSDDIKRIISILHGILDDAHALSVGDFIHIDFLKRHIDNHKNYDSS